LRADDPPKTGQFSETFKDRSPLSDMKVLGDRLGIPQAGLVDYDLASESFTVYVPNDYKADGSYGLIVFLNQDDNSAPYPGWTGVFDKHKFIWVCAAKSAVREEKAFARHLGLALDGAANLSAKYKIDPARVYVSGLAGTSSSSMLGVVFPDAFTGGSLSMFGSRFYKASKGPGENGAVTNPAYKTPADALLKLAKDARCHVLITGEKSPNLGPIDRSVFEGYKADGFKAIDLMEIPNAANVVPPAEWLEKGLVKLDDLRKALKDLPPVAVVPPVDPKNPNPTTPPVAPAVEVKKGAYQVTFDKRSPYSVVAQLSRVLPTVTRTTAEYDISKESFHVYVPAHYAPGKPFGLLVSLTSEVVGFTDQQQAGLWKNAIDKRNMIYVGINNCPPAAGDQKRIGLALDAVENIKQRYTIDDDRIYMIGVSQASPHVAKAALNFPQVFNGAIFLQGAAFYRDVVDGNVKILGGITPPANATLKEAKGASRFAFVLADSGQNRQILGALVKNWQTDGFTHAKIVEVAKLGNNIPGVASVGLAIDDVDKPLAKTDQRLMGEASRAERMKKLGEAWLLYEKAALRSTDDKRKADAEAKAEALRKQHEEGLAAARKTLAAGDAAAAKTALEKLEKEFGKMPSEEVETLLATLAPSKPGPRTPGTPGTSTTPVAGAETIAKNRLEAARKLLATNLAAGYKDLRDIAERYGQTPAGKEALAEADKTWADPEKRKLIESQTLEAEATRLLVAAKRFLDAGDIANAREKLNQIMEDYPDSKVSSDAAALLVGIKDK
jgi:hypothetical protein